MSATIPSTTLLSDLLKATGYDCPEDLQGKTFDEATAGSSEVVLEDNKTATITANGTVEITPTAGKDAMKKVTATVNVPSVGKMFAYSIETADPSSLEFKNSLMYSFTEITESGSYNFYIPRATSTGDYYFSLEKQVISVASVNSDGDITDDGEVTYNRVASKDITL